MLWSTSIVIKNERKTSTTALPGHLFGDPFHPDILKPLVTDDFAFKGPLMAAASSDEFISKLKILRAKIDMNADIHNVVSGGNTVVAQYCFRLSYGISVPACEWHDIRGGNIGGINQFCDPKHFQS